MRGERAKQWEEENAGRKEEFMLDKSSLSVGLGIAEAKGFGYDWPGSRAVRNSTVFYESNVEYDNCVKCRILAVIIRDDANL